MLKLKVDNREGKIIELLNKDENKEQNVEFEQLELADFQFWYNDELKLLFERKTITDLQASIKDGRYKNQKASVLSKVTTNQFFYIIEGSVKYAKDPKNNNDKMVQGAVINTMIRDNISFFFTKSVEETCELILSIKKRLTEHPDEYFQVNKIIQEQIVTISRNKIDTSKDCWKYQLCQVPDISEKTAEAITQTWSTSVLFYKDMFTTNDQEERKRKLETIKLTDDKGKKRKITSSAINSIMKFVLEE